MAPFARSMALLFTAAMAGPCLAQGQSFSANYDLTHPVAAAT